MKIGAKVWTGVHFCGEWHRTALGVVTGIHSGFYDVDVMSLHGGSPWITQHTHLEAYEDNLDSPSESQDK